MKVKTEIKGDAVIFHLSGKIMGGEDSTRFHGQIHEQTDAGKKKIVIALGEVEWMNSSGIGMLISILTTVKNNKGELRIANTPKKVQNLINIVQIERILKSYDTVEDALKSF